MCESDPSPAKQIKNIAECFDRLRDIRQFIRNRATQSDDAAAHCDWLEDFLLSGALTSSKQTSIENFFKADSCHSVCVVQEEVL